ncbi:MAG: CoA transferase [Proteobacteria bacterium]|nr:CoA transferase [Pseudomonadota bacterium]
MESMTTALEGLKVLDFTEYGAGPFCSMMLGDLGADVIKVEPPRGDAIRQWGPMQEGISAPFMQLNRSKRSVVLDLKNPIDHGHARELASRTDVLIENFRPGTMERLGLDYARLRDLNPRLIYCAMSGYGQTGPYRDRGGFDLVLQGHGGVMGVTGNPDGAPVKAGVPIIDFGASAHAVIGILSAYIARSRTGRGQAVDISLLDVPVAWLCLLASKYWASGEIQQPLGSAHPLSAPYQAFRAADGYLTIAAGNQRLWEATCEVLGLVALVGDPRFLTNNDRARNQAELVPLLEAVLEKRPVREWVEELAHRGVPCGPINRVDEVLTDPQVLHREMVMDLLHPRLGSIKSIGCPIKLSETPARLDRHPPDLGEHTAEVLAELETGSAPRRASSRA